MKRIVRGTALAAMTASVVAVLATAGTAVGNSASIGFDDSGPTGGSFGPKTKAATLSANGAKAVWNRDQGSVVAHNVVSDEGFFDSGQPTTDFDHFKVQLSAGSFSYYCTLHGSKNGRGMAGTIAVKPLVKQISPKKFRVTWATQDSTTGNRYDVDWRVSGPGKSSGKRQHLSHWKHWKQGTTALSAKFGADGSPVKVKASRSYEVRVRSRDSADASRVSDFSPTVRFGG